ncbi:uncharacterized protein LOC121865472 isoform X2 [Homarus americanus]|uniref:uncharacterized protein LOC121865472 isoform X2 n=1 Tax=Homarus americanus TaxID=6706 RepID=UPI001C45ADCF|nr:uncharacterized protein LOC121865472 isoform X2 [Homarus americanus]
MSDFLNEVFPPLENQPLENPSSVLMNEITPSSFTIKIAENKEDDSHGKTNCQDQISSTMHKVHPNSSLSEGFEAKSDNYYISQNAFTRSLESFRPNEYQSKVHIDWHNYNEMLHEKGMEDADHCRESSGSGYLSCNSQGEEVVDGIIFDINHIMSRPRSESIASLDYYRTRDTHLQVSAREELQNQRQDSPNNGRQMQQSRRLPYWLWFIIAKSLGIKLSPEDKPILATVLYTLTFMSAITYFLSDWWFTASDIVSDYTKTTVIDGTISIFFTLLWGALSLYANNLAYRLFSHKKFLDMLRLHSKTILKMNASIVLFALMLLLAVFNNINAFPNFKDETCRRVALDVLVCKVRYISRVVLSVFAVIWNYLVAFVLVSTCRTHVIGIRRFMQALEQDSRVYESRYMGLAQQANTDRPVLEEYTWFDEDYLDELRDPGGSDIDSNSVALIPQQRNQDDNETSEQRVSSSGTTSITVPVSSPVEGSLPSTSSTQSFQQTFSVPTEVSISSSNTTSGSHVRPVPLMSNSEILFKYWKIQARLRLSSVALQRWMMSVISLVIVWLAMNLVLWLTCNPTLIDLANFFLPLSLLPLLSSAYAEVNQEGLRLLKFICPLEGRLQMLYVLQNSPLQMTVYGFTVSYSTISTAAFGILLAFASKVLIQEISGPLILKN